MPPTPVVFFEDRDGNVPVRDWLDGLAAEARLRCLARLEMLEQFGHELDRPHAAYLGEDLYELRIKFYRVNYRILYFFHGRRRLSRLGQGEDGPQEGPSHRRRANGPIQG